MKFQELLNEGSFLIKNKSGESKRFKKDDSPEAKAWAASEGKKKAESHTQEWWEAKFAKGKWGDETVYPWDPIDRYDLDADLVNKLIKTTNIDPKNVDHWNFGRPTSVKRGGVDCAAITVSLFLQYTKDDDLGLEDDVEEMENITIAREPNNPKKLSIAH